MSTQSLERTLPHNIDAEKSVLGAILVNNENYYRVLESLKPEDFYLDAHRAIYRKMAELIETAANTTGLVERGYLSPAAEAQLQFQMRLTLARYGLVPPDKITIRKKMFANPSEEMFANLLDFYRIAWEYEPTSFPIQWDAEGKVTE